MVSYLDQGGVQHLVDKLLDRMYPVDSIYISTNSTSPASLYGGSWERYGTGRALISASDTDSDFTAGTTGGSKTHNHKYGIAVGSFYGHTLIAPNDAHPAVWSGLVSYDKDSGEATDGFHEWTKLEDRAVIGSGSMLGQSAQPYNARRYRYETDTKRESSLSPYVAVYVWRRTA
jgi:hypothetical protein